QMTARFTQSNDDFTLYCDNHQRSLVQYRGVINEQFVHNILASPECGSQYNKDDFDFCIEYACVLKEKNNIYVGLVVNENKENSMMQQVQQKLFSTIGDCSAQGGCNAISGGKVFVDSAKQLVMYQKNPSFN